VGGEAVALLATPSLIERRAVCLLSTGIKERREIESTQKIKSSSV
jgi:hypothetical protein